MLKETKTSDKELYGSLNNLTEKTQTPKFQDAVVLHASRSFNFFLYKIKDIRKDNDIKRKKNQQNKEKIDLRLFKIIFVLFAELLCFITVDLNNCTSVFSEIIVK